MRIECRVGSIEWLTSIMPYNSTLKTHRRLFHNFLGTRNSIAKHEEHEVIEARKFLYRLLVRPDDFYDHLQA